MIKKILIFILTLQVQLAFSQNRMRPVEELVQVKDKGWPFVQQLIDSASNKVEVIPCDTSKAKDALYKTQVTTRSPMGAVIFATGGILIDDGWIRILGSGSKKIGRSLPDWNKGKSFKEFGETPSYVLIADDAIGGFFAINGGSLGKEKGTVYYLSPDRLVWEPLHLSYTDFLYFCFRDDLGKFYQNLRWTNWNKDVKKLKGNSVFSFSPYLWTREGKDINKNKRRKITAEEQFQFNIKSRAQLGLDKTDRTNNL